ncbi:GNAT family N-acetyltransferase [Saccharopolyspora sp. NPDC000359]|uniref:GNAT family N-acetyltransferase n=1 Tax=Saccharopolyspora sp. NPDC000359 TaxID=3154251 RepID=UPI0033298F40
MVELRTAEEADHPVVVAAIQRWWSDSRSPEAARELSLLVPRLFLQHFSGTSFIAEQDGRMAGFLIGFASADRPVEAYIHFVGVDPELRRSGLARRLYGQFFAAVARSGRTRVHCVTSPANTGSIAFHRSMGFQLRPGDAEIGGIPVHRDYDGLGHDRVCFVRDIDPAAFR